MIDSLDRKENRLERKLSAYALASGAFLALSAGQAEAGIVSSGPLDVVITPGSGVPSNNDGSTYTISLGGSGASFTFENFASAGVNSGLLGVVSDSTTSQVVTELDLLPSPPFAPGSSFPYASALGSGTTIGSSSSLSDASSGIVMGKLNSALPFFQKGPWLGAVNQYLGLSFNNGGTTDYGWAQLSFSTTTGIATLTGWAYDDTGASITTPTPTSTPEPATLASALLALGAVGVGALLRNRKQAEAAA